MGMLSGVPRGQRGLVVLGGTSKGGGTSKRGEKRGKNRYIYEKLQRGKGCFENY